MALGSSALADEGRIWADQVLRREDMALYMWRLILEWARVCDDKRDVLGWVDDLKEAGAEEGIPSQHGG